MVESTTILIQRQLDRLASDSKAKADLIQVAHDRLVILTRKLLGGFPQVRTLEETQSIFNEAFLRLDHALDELKPTTVRQFMGLAALEIRRVLLDIVRKLRGRGREQRPKNVSLGGGADPEKDIATDVEDSDPGTARLNLLLDLLESVAKLPDEEREVLELLIFQGLTQPEAAQVIGVHEDTVKRRWSRARVVLADKLSAYDLNAAG
jgi:RNA polymerase sigma-70 factor (ECF subfamily)